MRIAFFAWRDLANDLAGGSEILIDRLAAGLGERGHDVSLVCAAPAAPRPYRVVVNGGRHTQYLRAPVTHRRHFRDADIVVDVANGMAFYAALWRRGPSLCLVNHVHTDQWSQWFPAPVASFGRALERHAMPRAYRHRLFVAVSPSTAESLERLGVDPERIRIVHNGVDLPVTVPTESPEPLFFAIGRLVPHKRFDILLRAWELVRPVTGGRLVIAGEGPEWSKLHALAGDRVELVGRIGEADKQRLYGEAWALLHPAMHEGWGLVVTEAAASATPTIGFWVPGVRDSVVHGQTGMLVDTEEALVRQWIELALDAKLRHRLGTAASARAAEFSWDATVDRFAEVAGEAILRHGRPGRPGTSTSRPHSDRVIDLDAASMRAPRVSYPLAPQAAAPPLSIVVPAYNEGARLPSSLPRLIAALDGSGTELIVVDDGSDDATLEIASRCLRDVPGSHVIGLPRHRGKGAAVRAGVERATGRHIVFMDADLATDLSHLPQVVEALADAHIVIGSRTAPGAVMIGLSPVRAVLEWGFNRVARSLTGLDTSDTQCGFKAFRGPVAKLLFHLLRDEGLAFDVELLAMADRIGYRTVEVPVQWRAVRGSHIRIPADTVAMTLSVGRIRARTRPGQFTAGVEAWCKRGVLSGEDIASTLRDHLAGSLPVVPWNDRALVLLPFAAPGDSAAVATRLGARFPDVGVRTSLVAAADLLHPSAVGARTALVESRWP